MPELLRRRNRREGRGGAGDVLAGEIVGAAVGHEHGTSDGEGGHVGRAFEGDEALAVLRQRQHNRGTADAVVDDVARL